MHQISHPVRPEDPLFVSFDPCHIVKNVRNQFLDEDRRLSKDGNPISGQAIRTLYENQKMLPIKPVRFLTRKTVYPTNFEKMNVRRALQIFSTEVIAALEFSKYKNLPGFRNLDATLEFMKNIQKWLQIHNVCNTTHYIRSRNDNSRHFGMIDDGRLEWLEQDFLGYLQNWEEFARTNQPIRGKTKVKTFLTKETYKAITITTRSTVACIKYLIESGFHFVLTRKFNSDDIEGIFSAVRSTQGWNDQANAVGSMYALETILKTGLFSSSTYGNCGEIESEDFQLSCRKRNVTGRHMPVGSIIQLNAKQKQLAAMLSSPPDIPNVTTKTAGVAMVAGFALRLLKDKHSCPHAGEQLVGLACEQINKLISLQDHGGLLYPSRRFVCFVKLVFDILQLGNNYWEIKALVKSWKITLMDLLPDDCLECGCLNADHTKLNRELIMSSLCKIYFNNTCFNVTNAANDKPKFSSKPTSKKVKKLS